MGFMLGFCMFIIQLMMHNGGTMPFWLFFTAVEGEVTQMPYQNVCAHASTLFWTNSSQPTPRPSHLQCLESCEVKPTSTSLTSAALPASQADGRQEGSRKTPRTKKRRQRNAQKELESAKKNSQSNIVNQLYSFFNSYQKSQKIVQKAIKRFTLPQSDSEKIKSIFYNIVRLINYKRGRRYVNRESILSFYTPARFTEEIPDIEEKLSEVRLLTLPQLCLLFRTTTAYFLKTLSVNAILTSKRISVLAKNEHLRRRRRVLEALPLSP